MSEIKVNKISPKQTCTQLTLGDSGDTIIVTSGANLNTDTIKNLNSSSIITQTNATTITLGFSGSTIAIASGATQTGFGRSGSVNWDTTVKTSNFTAVSGNGYFVNTTSAAITVTLPASPAAGDIVAISDYANTTGTNKIFVSNNGNKINGVTDTYRMGTAGLAVTLVYVDSTMGWKSVDDATVNATGVIPSNFIVATGGTITTCGNCKIHTFTGSGNFTVCCAGNPTGSNTVSYFVLAGGGGGGGSIGGGGGAGGYRISFPNPATGGFPVTATTYPITVGAGGNGTNNPTSPLDPSRGGNSVFSSITSTGGGAGAPGALTHPGGSGGGSGHRGGTGGTGNTPPVSPSQGNPGGNTPDNAYAGSGGGGAGAAGNPAPASGYPSTASPGGDGSTNTISGSSVTYAGGGGGGGFLNDGGGGGSGGSGGGGNGGSGSPGNVFAQPGTRGSGGGGGAYGPGPANGIGGNGGAGQVIIRYKYQ